MVPHHRMREEKAPWKFIGTFHSQTKKPVDVWLFPTPLGLLQRNKISCIRVVWRSNHGDMKVKVIGHHEFDRQTGMFAVAVAMATLTV